jgi:hypothetical protein
MKAVAAIKPWIPAILAAALASVMAFGLFGSI